MAQNLHQILIHAVFHKRTHAATIRPNDQPLLNSNYSAIPDIYSAYQFIKP